MQYENDIHIWRATNKLKKTTHTDTRSGQYYMDGTFFIFYSLTTHFICWILNVTNVFITQFAQIQFDCFYIWNGCVELYEKKKKQRISILFHCITLDQLKRIVSVYYVLKVNSDNYYATLRKETNNNKKSIKLQQIFVL